MIHKKLVCYFLLLSLGFTVISCRNNGMSSVSNEIESSVVKPKNPLAYSSINSLLVQASKEAMTAQEKLVQIQTSQSEPSPFPVKELTVPPELKQLVSLDWIGPAEESADKLAQLIKYRFLVVGNPPAIEPIIYLQFKNTPIVKIFEQIGLQSFPIGEVIVDPNVKRIEYRYLNPGNSANLEMIK